MNKREGFTQCFFFPRAKTLEKNICNTCRESGKNEFHMVRLVHPLPCSSRAPSGLPLFLPPLRVAIPPPHAEAPASSEATALLPESPRSLEKHRKSPRLPR